MCTIFWQTLVVDLTSIILYSMYKLGTVLCQSGKLFEDSSIKGNNYAYGKGF